MLVDERDIHRELAVALDELLRAVERIDEPITLPFAPRRVIGGQRLLGEDRQARVELLERLADDAVRDLVRFGQRRVVALARDGEIGASVDVEYRAARVAGDLASCVEQTAVLARVDHEPSCIIET